MATVENTHTPECYPDPKHPGWWYCTGEGHVPNGEPVEDVQVITVTNGLGETVAEYVHPGNPPVLYWRHVRYPTMIAWAYDLDHHSGTIHRYDQDSAWQRVKLVPVDDAGQDLRQG